MPVRCPTVGVSMETVPIAEPAGHFGAVRVAAENCASEQATRSPRAPALALSDTPSGSRTAIFDAGLCGAAGVDAGNSTVVVSELAVPGEGDDAEKRTAGRHFGSPMTATGQPSAPQRSFAMRSVGAPFACLS